MLVYFFYCINPNETNYYARKYLPNKEGWEYIKSEIQAWRLSSDNSNPPAANAFLINPKTH